MLWHRGDKPSGLTLVLDGRVRILRGSGGRQMGLHWGEAGATLGEIPFFTRSPYPATAIAVEPTTCLHITHAAFDRALRVDPELAFILLERLAARVENLVERVAHLSNDSVQSRLAQFIVERSGTDGGHLKSSFSLGMTQSDLAEELGTVREVVVRALRALKNTGAIAGAVNGRYRVTDIDRLKAAAETE